jgi:hypothetical protein
MRRSLVPLVSAAVLLGLAAAAAADNDAETILDRALKAHGGKEALTKYQAGKSKSKGKLFVLGQELEFTQQAAYMLPDKFKESMQMSFAGQNVSNVTVANGDQFSITVNGMAFPVTDAVKTALKEARYLMKVSRLAALAGNKEYKLAALPETKVEGKPAVGIKVSSKGHKDANLYFSKDTGLLVKVEQTVLDPMTQKEVKEERIITEYGKKGKDGIPPPKKLKVLRDGNKHMEAEVTEGQFLEKLPDSEFKTKAADQ